MRGRELRTYSNRLGLLVHLVADAMESSATQIWIIKTTFIWTLMIAGYIE